MRTATYSEDGDRFEVIVLADKSTEERHAFDLQVIETREKFSVDWLKKGGYCYGMWRLTFPDGNIIP